MKRKSAPSVCSGPLRAVALAVVCGLASGVSAQMWDGGAGSLLWTDGDNWEPDGVPGTMDDVLIDVPGVLIGSIVAEVNSLSAPQLSMTSANLIVHDISTIDGLTVGGCCVTTIESNAMFTLTGVSEFPRAANFRGSGPFNLMQNHQEVFKAMGDMLSSTDQGTGQSGDGANGVPMYWSGVVNQKDQNVSRGLYH